MNFIMQVLRGLFSLDWEELSPHARQAALTY